MKKFLTAICLLLCASIASAALFSGPPGATHVGQIATRSSTVNANFSVGTTTNFYSKSGHVWPNGGYGFKVVLQGWIGNGNGDNPATGTNTVNTYKFEYPQGTCTAVTFSGSASGTIPNGGELVSDPINVQMPPGGIGWFYENRTNTTTLLWGGVDSNASMGDSMQTSTSTITPASPCATPSGNASGSTTQSVPSAIIGTTNQPSICIGGNSIGYGRADTADSTGNLGYIARSVGRFYGFINMSISGTQTTAFNSTNAPKRAPFARNYCTHFIFEGGVNNFILATQTGLQVQAGLQAVYGNFCLLGLKCYQTLITPVTSSNNAWATTGGQTANFSEIPVVNTWILGVPSPLGGVFNPTTTFNVGTVWCAPGCTVDGIHPLITPTLTVVNAGTVTPTAFTYPP